MFSCARICVEVDLEKGIPEAINLSIDEWNHMQTMDYEKISFKCKYCHKYGHFAKFFPKKPEKSFPEESPEEGWNVASKRKGARVAPMQSHINLAKNTVRNKFQALTNEENEEGEHAEGEETNSLHVDETTKESSPLVLDEQLAQSSPE